MARRNGALVALIMFVAVVAASFAAAANDPPVARISAHRASAASGYAVVYDGSTSSDADGQVVRYQWLFGDGTTGSGSPVTHTYSQAVSFTVTLLVGDDGGAVSLVTQVVNVASLSTQATAIAASTAPAAAQVPIGDDIGLRAPEIALPTVSDGMVYLSAYLGRPVLVEFWLSTCPGCRASTPELEEFRSRYANQGLVVMLVVLDRSLSAAVAYLEQYGFRNFVLAWESNASRPTMAAYGVSVTPTAFLIDRTGVIRYAGHPSGLSDQFLTTWL
jgi:thiol-disulfide isomerase/thioredoxin